MSELNSVDAQRFHEGTNYPGGEFLGEWPALDPATRPSPYKIYTTLDPIPLPTSFPASPKPVFDAIRDMTDQDGGGVPDLDALARVLFFSNGVTKHIRRGGRDWPFRAAPCTGALYHVELYVVCGELPGLAAGVYHYGAHDNGLRQLRSGDFRRVLNDATGSVAHAPAIVVATSTFWRNAWKYQARAYRHTYWDTGTMLPNTLATASSVGVPARVVIGFVDESVNRLLDVDGEQEFAVALVPLGRAAARAPVAPPVSPLDLPFDELPRPELDEPAIRAAHAASSLATADDVIAWRGVEQLPNERSAVEGLVPLQPLLEGELPMEPVETVILRRGSTRQFTHDAITWPQLSTILSTAATDVANDIGQAPLHLLGDVYLIINAVDGVAPGTYVFHPDHDGLELLVAGNFRDAAHHLALDQDLGGDAAVNIYVMTDLAEVSAALGNRGYRAAQLAASIFAGKVYLASYALGVGATGLTFWDNDVTEFFAPHATGKHPMFLVAVGHKA